MMNRFFEQMVRRPAAALGASLELLDRRLRGREIIDGMVSRIVHTLSRGADEPAGRIEPEPVENQQPEPDPLPQSDGPEATPAAVEREPAEVFVAAQEDGAERAGLRDDLLKLVHYKVLFVRRGYEAAFQHHEELVAENLDDAAFTAWKIAEFIQELQSGRIPAPPRWRERPPPGAELRAGNLVALREEEKKHLRVYYEVRERYPREALKYEELEIEALRQIRDALP